MIHSVIIGTGSYIPEMVVSNDSFLPWEFREESGKLFDTGNETIIEKFESITGIHARRYARPDQKASDLAYQAAKEAIAHAAIDQEQLDYVIVAHNFGDVAMDSNRTDQVPSLASRVKALLEIKNPDCVAYDLPFGCPGWVEAMIQANYFIRSGDAKKCLVIGSETLSRVIDPHDRDSMIFSDGAGAVVLAAVEGTDTGILSHKTQTHAVGYIDVLNMGHSNDPETSDADLFIKMQGRKVYEFAVTHVPNVVKAALDQAGISIDQVSKVLIHQANEKMDNAILARLFKLYGHRQVPDHVMPMTIGWLGNSSVATVPTLLDLLMKNKLEEHAVRSGDIIVFASVGAGMNINAMVYRM